MPRRAATIEPPTLPAAPLAAQQALEEQLTLLRWAEGSAGSAHIGDWMRLHGTEEVADASALGVTRTLLRILDQRNSAVQAWTLPLRYGETFYWEPRIAQATAQAAAELHGSDEEVRWRFDRETLPAPQGFFYTDAPGGFGKLMDHACRGIGWSVCFNIDKSHAERDRFANVQLPATGGFGMDEAHGIMITCWLERPHDTVLRPGPMLIWPFGTTQRDTVGSVSFGKEVGVGDIFSTLIAFVQQRIVIAGHGHPVGRVTRKRVAREAPSHQPVVTVITLRRTAAVGYDPPEEPTGRHVSVQFPVRGFWRQQCHNPHGHADAEVVGGCADHQAVYIHPHMRGDPSLPLLVKRGTLYDVAR